MPTYARGQIVVEDMVGVYHCIARCVRRAFLCGVDPYTGLDYSHRKAQLSGYKSNKFNWLGKGGSGSCDFDSPNA
jgi:hypothetical protein